MMLHWLDDIIGLISDCAATLRTPLNAVSMSLSLIQTELANLIGLDTSIQEMDQYSPMELERLVATSSHSNHDDSSPGKKKTIECLCLIKDTQSHMQSAVDVLSDLLTYDRIERGEIQLELSLVNIWSVIQLAAAEFVLPASNKGIQFTVQYMSCSSNNNSSSSSQPNTPVVVNSVEHLDTNARDTRVVVDAVRLTQCIRNFLSNAVKFTQEGGKICMHACLTKTYTNDHDNPKKKCVENRCGREFVLANGKICASQCGSMSIRVTDDGVGMTQDQMKRTFCPGAQFNVNELQCGGGSGLGLFITKGFVEQMGGIVSVKSEGIHQGSTFTIQLPMHCSANETDAVSVEDTSHHLKTENSRSLLSKVSSLSIKKLKVP